MSEFDALLKRSFAEAPEPVDDGFTVRISHAVDRHEKAALVRQVVWGVTMAVAGTAVAGGLYQIFQLFGPELAATAGLEVARAHGAISNAPDVQSAAQGIVGSLGAGMTQILLMTGMIAAGGAVALRSVRE